MAATAAVPEVWAVRAAARAAWEEMGAKAPLVAWVAAAVETVEAARLAAETGTQRKSQIQ